MAFCFIGIKFKFIIMRILKQFPCMFVFISSLDSLSISTAAIHLKCLVGEKNWREEKYGENVREKNSIYFLLG